QGRTNFYLTVYDKDGRQNARRVTSSENTVIISDGMNLAFSMEAPLVPNLPQWGGGFVRIAGQGRFVNGVPAALHGNLEGVFVDTRPGDLNGTTGLVLRAKINTLRAPLRIQPAN